MINALIDAHNAKFPTFDAFNDSHYIISITGMKGCYFTLYFFSAPIAKLGRRNPYLYRQNLSQSFDDAVMKFLAMGKNCPVLCMDEEALTNAIKKYEKETFKSGKHAGKSFDEVYNEDINYILWYKKHLDEERENYKRNPYTGKYYTLTKKQEEIYPFISALVETYHQEKIALRRETIASEYETESKIGATTIVITTASKKIGCYGEYVEMRGKCGDKYYIFYPKGFENINLNEVIGKNATFQSAHTAPIEIYGVKYNSLSYLKGFSVAY